MIGLLIGSSLSSQKQELNLISKLSTEQGLVSNVIYSMMQDDNGFVWIATDQGVNKFDGKHLTLFAQKKGRYSLCHNRAQAMLVAPDGNIWIGTSDGLNIYDYQLDSIIQIRSNTQPLKLVYNDITVLAASTDKSKTWIGTYGNGVNYFDWTKKEFAALTLPKAANAEVPLNVMSLLDDSKGRLWIGTQTDGLYRYDQSARTLSHYPLPETARNIRSIFEDSSHRLWVGTSSGCYIFNEAANRLELVKYPQSLVGNSIGAITEDRNGIIWMGTELFLMNFAKQSFSAEHPFNYSVFEHGESMTRLNCPSINSVFADRENNIWVGTAWGGVNMLKGTAAKFTLIKHDAESASSLPNSPLTAVSPDKNGNLLIATMGTDNVGLCMMNLQSGNIKEFPLDKKLSGFIYQSMMVDSRNNLWIGTYNKGLLKVDLKGSGFVQYLFDDKNPNSLPSNDIRTIFEDGDKTIWIGTNIGLAKIDAQNNVVTRCDIVENKTIGIRCIKQSTNGLLWLGTYGDGAITYDPATGNVDLSPTNFNPRVVIDILVNGDSVWLASQGEGLCLVTPKTKASTVFDESTGLSSNYIVSLLRDRLGNIWIGNSKGIDKLNPTTKEIENFNSGDGLQSREFSERGAAALPNGSMAFAGYGGLNVFDPLSVTKDDKGPSVVFTKLLVSNVPVFPSDDNRTSPLVENIILADKIELKPNQSVFTIEFMGINYNANPKIQYAYFLEGADDTWNLLGSQNSVTFRNLRPGKYTFKVKASSPDAVWSDANTASIVIVVHPPFWVSGWAYLIYFAFVLSVLYVIWMFLNMRVQAANRLKVEREKREKEEELHQEKLQFFTNISHEFRTPLTLIVGPLETMLSHEVNEVKKTDFKSMLRNANRLLTMVNQLLDFRKAESGQMKLKIRKSDLLACVREALNAFEVIAKQKNIQLQLSTPNDLSEAWFDEGFLNISLSNLLSNAIKFTPYGGAISVVVAESKSLTGKRGVDISVTDNGVGITPQDLPHIFDLFFQGEEKSKLQQGSGIGLHLVKNLVEQHHGSIDVKSTPNEATTFKIVLPIDKSDFAKDELMDESAVSVLQAPVDGSAVRRDKPTTAPMFEMTKHEAKKRVLVVEDNPEIRHYIVGILGADYQVDEAENGVVGLEMMMANDFDLVVTDLMMPEMDGMEMCRQLKTSIETSHIPIIMLTAKSDVENLIEGVSIGADDYITKPFHPQHLTIRVAKLIELRELLKERYGKKILMGEMHKPDTKADSPDELFLQKTITLVFDKLMDPELNGDMLAAQLGISRMGLYRKIKALTGQTTSEFIRQIRLKKACELLSIRGKNISEVCYEVGFNSPSYFTTCFTEVYKMTPSEYVKSIKH